MCVCVCVSHVAFKVLQGAYSVQRFLRASYHQLMGLQGVCACVRACMCVCVCVMHFTIAQTNTITSALEDIVVRDIH